MANITTDAETNVITTQQMVRAREIDFVNRFIEFSLQPLITALGITRRIPLEEGTTMYVYKTIGTLQSGEVAEGEIIPLSQYEREKTPIGEITLKKWRKATTAEAIKKSGYNEAVNLTDAKMLQDVQKGIRTDFFNAVTGLGTTVVGGATLQAVLAQTWGQLQVLFENDAVETVHFVHPLTIADYLATATVSLQTAFGLNYISDFLGMGTVFLTSQVPQGKVYSTARENLILYYVSMGGEIARAFDLTSDETGYIGTHLSQNDQRAQIERLVMSGIQFLVEYAAGIVVGQIDNTPTLGSVTVASTGEGATASGDSVISATGYSLGAGESFVYKTAASTAPAVTYGQKLGSTWTTLTNAAGTNITPTATHTKITVAAIDAQGRAQAAGSADLTKKA